MGLNTEKEFSKLQEYSEELSKNIRDKMVMRADRLITIRDHIELCDYIADSKKDIVILLITFDCWERCYGFYLRHKSITDNIYVPELRLKTLRTKDTTVSWKKEPQPSNNTDLMRIEKPSPVPRAEWKDNLQYNDIRFLRALKIAPYDEPIYPDTDDSNKA